MLLHVEELGPGPNVAVLLHGMMGSAESWWRVAELLAGEDYRVLALDLPGHGLSPRQPDLTLSGAIASVVETVALAAPNGIALTMGHSFGGVVLAAAAPQLHPDLAVYVDVPFTLGGGSDRDGLIADYEISRRERTAERLRETRPHYGPRDREVEAVAAERFDSRTAASLALSAGGTWLPAPGSIVIRAEPSSYVSGATAEELSSRGVQVRSIPGAAHSVWYSHFDEFVAVLPEVFPERPTDDRPR